MKPEQGRDAQCNDGQSEHKIFAELSQPAAHRRLPIAPETRPVRLTLVPASVFQIGGGGQS